MDHPLQALLYVLLGYFGLQLLLNLSVRFWAQRSRVRVQAALIGSFWASVVNALYFIVLSALLHIWQIAPNGKPPHMGFWALAGLPLGGLLWYASAKARGLGIRLFGQSNLVAGEDAILRFPPGPSYLTWGVLNQTLIQPLGRELFLRGVFLPMVVARYGWGWGVAATLLVEVAPRLNVVWLPYTLLYGTTMCLLFYCTGGALCGLVAAAVSGLLHSVTLAYLTMREAEQSAEDRLIHSIERQH